MGASRHIRFQLRDPASLYRRNCYRPSRPGWPTATSLVTAELCMGDLVNLRTERKRAKRRRSSTRPSQPAAPWASKDRPHRGPIQERQARTASTGTGLKRETGNEITGLKRSIVIAGHKTSVSLEDAFWKGLKDIASTAARPFPTWSQHRFRSQARQSVVGDQVIRADHYQTRNGERGESAQAPRDMMMVPPPTASVLRPE